MLKFFLYAGLVLVLLVVALLALASRKPDHFRVERSVLIDASPERIYPLVEDFRLWLRWSPYETRDPEMARIYSGAEKGAGAVYEWDGDRSIGSGSMEILEAEAPSRLVIALHFRTPMQADHTAIFTFVPEGDATRVTWAMEGKSGLIARVFHLFFDMDKMVGADFETGLAGLKAEAERELAQ